MVKSITNHSFTGHAVPATGYASFGIFMLGLTLKRARNLPRGLTFAEAHIPENNPSLLIGSGLALIPVSLFGIWFEFFRWDVGTMTHMTLYLTFMFIGAAALGEGTKRLPRESARMAIALTMVLHYVIWNEHALMKARPVEARLHELLAQMCLVTAAIVSYSIKYPKNAVVYVMQLGICLLMGLWLYASGVCATFVRMPVGMAGVLLCSLTIFVAVVIMLGVAFLVPTNFSETVTYRPVSEREQMEPFCVSIEAGDDK